VWRPLSQNSRITVLTRKSVGLLIQFKGSAARKTRLLQYHGVLSIFYASCRKPCMLDMELKPWWSEKLIPYPHPEWIHTNSWSLLEGHSLPVPTMFGRRPCPRNNERQQRLKSVVQQNGRHAENSVTSLDLSATQRFLGPIFYVRFAQDFRTWMLCFNIRSVINILYYYAHIIFTRRDDGIARSHQNLTQDQICSQLFAVITLLMCAKITSQSI